MLQQFIRGLKNFVINIRWSLKKIAFYRCEANKLSRCKFAI